MSKQHVVMTCYHRLANKLRVHTIITIYESGMLRKDNKIWTYTG